MHTQILKLSSVALAAALAVPSLAKPAATKTTTKATTKTTTTTAVKKVEVDTSASSLKWLGKKVTGQHDGTVALRSGYFEVAGTELKGGTFEIDMQSIANTDLKDKDANSKLVGHLKSDDFFSVEKNPTATLKITNVKPLAKPVDGKTHEITGDLTVKGKTHPVTFPAMVEVKSDHVKAKGTVTVDRTKYDVKYGSGKFFQNLGDKVINDEFTIDLDVVSKSQKNKVAAQ